MLLLTDLYHLDHYGNSAHFPGHAVVLAGYDEEFVHLSDTGFEELQTTTRHADLDRARHSDHPAYPLAGHMFTAGGPVTEERLRAAIPAAIERAAREMVASPSASSPASARSSASPRRPAAGPRSPRTGSGAPASATR